MKDQGALPPDAEAVLAQALGHLRNATASLLGADDPRTETLLLGIQGLELQGMLADVWPAYIDAKRSVAESLAEAERLLAEVIDHVPLAVWTGVQSLRRRIDDGHR